MRFFRSEEHARRHQQTAEADILTLAQAAALARAWYERKLTRTWRRHTPDEAQALFAKLGFDKSFWQLS